MSVKRNRIERLLRIIEYRRQHGKPIPLDLEIALMELGIHIN